MKWLNVALIVCLAAVLAVQAQAQQEGIVQNPATGDFEITYEDQGGDDLPTFGRPTSAITGRRSEECMAAAG